MREQLSLMVGGQQGEGIDSTGVVLANVLNRLGYQIYGQRTFSSRIKGGHTNFKIRVARRRVLSLEEHVDLMMAFDQDTINRNASQLRDGSIVIFDSDGKRQAKLPEGPEVVALHIPISQIAREAGAVIMKNMVATGAAAALLDLDRQPFHNVIQERFGRRGEKMVASNRQAFDAGYDAALSQMNGLDLLKLAPGDDKRRHLMAGNEAAAFGALAAGCRFMAAYPITPASEVMHWLVRKLPKYGGVVVQAEDEIASMAMAIGAGYAGVRSLTATSGPGLSLKMETLGYAGMIEAPVVIVAVQRGGPSTGMPTKHEQSDLLQMLYGTHGDLTRIILAPTNVEECFYYAAEAFNLAERYQTPVILALDLSLGLSVQTVEGFDFDRINIDRGSLITQEELDQLNGQPFKRYAFTESGISPRSIPGMPGGLHLATGVEHDETGHITENRQNRIQMMNKRLRKIAGAQTNGISTGYFGDEEPELLLVGWGSAMGPINEAVELLQAEGRKVASLAVKLLSPLPAAEIEAVVNRADKVVVVENNAQGQLNLVLRQHLDVPKGKLGSFTKYDGTSFLAQEIVAHCREVL